MKKLLFRWEFHDQEHTYTVTNNEEVTIGRRDDCDIVLPMPTISRQHALIFPQDGKFYVRNTSRTNSVRLNDTIRLKYDQVSQLNEGDRLRLGPIKLLVFDATTAPDDIELRIRCTNCGRISDYEPKGFCPWCGMSLAGGQTLI